MRGTKFGPMVVAGQSTNSNLLVLVKHQADPSIAMPRSQTPGKPSEWLLPQQINLIEKWIVSTPASPSDETSALAAVIATV